MLTCYCHASFLDACATRTLVRMHVGRGGQLGVEGFTMGSTYIAVSAAFTTLTFVVPRLKDVGMRNALGAGCILLAVGVFFKIFSLYSWKAGYGLHTYFFV